MAPDIYDGNTDLEKYLVYFDQLAMFNMWNEPIKAMILGFAVTIRLEKQKFNIVTHIDSVIYVGRVP